MTKQVEFTSMAEGTRAEYDLVFQHERDNASQVADRMLAALRTLDGPSPYRITRLEHCLQSATRAETDGASDEMVAIALLHDIGDVFGPLNHSQVAAAILRPYVSDQSWWIVQHHGLFQGYYWFEHYGRNPDERERYRDHPHYDATVAFCENWDQNCFDPAYRSKPLEHFEPLVRALFAGQSSGFV